MHPQLTLPLGVVPSASFDTFTTGESNRLTVAGVEAFAAGSLDDAQLYIWGEAGAGKSHLLSASCQRVNSMGYRVAYLPGELAKQPQSLLGLEQCDLVCIDDVQQLGHVAEEDLFHCINRCRATGTRLLFSADSKPGKLGLQLADLTTRLDWGLVFQLDRLADAELSHALRHEIEIRALQVSDEVLEYLLRRFPRDMASLKKVVDHLDNVSLSEQRRITIPLIREALAG